jgi:Protein of unknown function (DUF3048) N-terminal domain/Protein of unknown function (DUF3048) C-terminal domain
MIRRLLPVLISLVAIAGCAPQIVTVEVAVTPTPAPTGTPTPITETPTATLAATVTPRVPDVGATPIPDDYDPLTGMIVSDPSVLDRRPLVIKVSNESPEVRPQSGLSFADNVWEYQMEGFQQTRYTAIYYSRVPQRVGSVRSARLIDVEQLIYMYDGLLVYSGCSIGVCYVIGSSPIKDRAFREDKVALVRMPDIPRPGTNFYHILFALPDKVWQAADQRGVNHRPSLEPLVFDPVPPPNGIGTGDFIIDYPDLGPLHHWHYDPDKNNWLSFTQDQRERAPEQPDIDLLTQMQLAFDNVVLIYADHSTADFIEDEPNQLPSVRINLVGAGDAVVMRDGKRYNGRWVRDKLSDMISLVGGDGKTIPLRPGTTWFNVYSANRDQPDVTFKSK